MRANGPSNRSADGGSELQNFRKNEVVQMHNRVVSIASLMVVVASVFFFLASAWGIMSQRLDEGSGIMAMGGWLIAAIVFSYRYADPKWLDPVSIVKSR
jgi:hypothetical protein